MPPIGGLPGVGMPSAMPSMPPVSPVPGGLSKPPMLAPAPPLGPQPSPFGAGPGSVRMAPQGASPFGSMGQRPGGQRPMGQNPFGGQGQRQMGFNPFGSSFGAPPGGGRMGSSGDRGAKAERVTPSVMTFFIEYDPEPSLQKVREQEETETRQIVTMEEIKREERAFKKPRSVPGIEATYYGTTTVSDSNGQIMFGRMHTGNELRVIITPAIVPVLIDENLVSYMKPSPDEPLISYNLVREKNPHTTKWEWLVKKETTTKTERIPIDAIVILADPKLVYFKEGAYASIKGENFFLPTVYVRRVDAEADEIAIRFLTANRYFAPIRLDDKKSTERYSQAIIP